MIQIARNTRLRLASRHVFLKNRVWINVDAGLWRFRVLFLPQKSVAQFVFGAGACGATAPLSSKRGSLNAVSRLKGIETRGRIVSEIIHNLFECSFPFEGN